jgi:Carboxypeptidase regulatory-like domain
VGALVNVLRSPEVPETGLVPEQTDRRTVTADDGAFRVRQGAGGYLVQVCEPDEDIPTVCREMASGVDYAITYVGGSGTSDSWVLQQSLLPVTSDTRDLGEVTVRPTASLAGTITGAAEGEEVRVMRLNDTVAFRTWTDARGDYRIEDLVPGRYYVAFGGSGELPWSSAPVDLAADTTTDVDGTLDPGARLRARLTTVSTTSPRGTEVLLRRSGGEMVAAAYADGRGRIEVGGLTPGRYVATVGGPGTRWRATSVAVNVLEGHETLRPTIRLHPGTTVRVAVREGGRKVTFVPVEIRDRRGTPVGSTVADERGAVEVSGLSRGRYVLVAAGAEHFGMVRLFASGRDTVRVLPALSLDRQFLTLRGRTAPHAVVEATTSDLCPPDETPRFGTFQELVSADALGRYRIDRLVPGRYMLGADGWPREHAPRCWSGVRLRHDLRRDLPLREGVTVTGRLVYAGTDQPVVTPLSYELFHQPHLTTNPTEEHPTRARTLRATGRFTIERVHPEAEVTGRLAREAGDGINDPSYFVTFPFQDGTPYWLDTEISHPEIPASGTVVLGDLQVVTHGT